MSMPSNVTPFPVEPRMLPRREAPATRPFTWSVRREVWENRSLTVAPFVVAVLVVAGCAYTAVSLPETVRGFASLDASARTDAVSSPYCNSAGVFLLTAFLVGAFYCADALGGERRDRSILFWKSMPVSDLTAVLAKASVPFVVLPAIVLSVLLATHVLVFALNALVLVATGTPVRDYLASVPLARIDASLFFVFPAVALWHAPIYAWLLLVSAWARRAPLMWAVLPWLACFAVERVAFGSWRVAELLQYRALGWADEAFAPGGPSPETIAPMKLVCVPGFWLGLAFAVGCLAAAVRLRRRGGPI